MNAFVVLSCLVACSAAAVLPGAHVTHHAHPAPVVRAASEYVSPAAHLVRAPQHDSALVESQRYGGNFAYKTVEKPAYAEVRPIVRKEVVETGVSYHEGPAHVTKHVIPQPAVVQRSYETIQPAPVVTEHTQYRSAPAVYHSAVAAPLYRGHLAYGAGYNAYGAPLTGHLLHDGLVY